MAVKIDTSGRRERNKRLKLERITAAATQLFDERGVDSVTTQQIADQADVATGTLFLYARNKAELLLLVHNVRYRSALDEGIDDASKVTDRLDAVMAIIRPIVVCNREQQENGRAYLREVVFGDPDEPHHRAALELTTVTAHAIEDVLSRGAIVDRSSVSALARVILAAMFVSITATVNSALTDEQVADDIRTQVAATLAGLGA